MLTGMIDEFPTGENVGLTAFPGVQETATYRSGSVFLLKGYNNLSQ